VSMPTAPAIVEVAQYALRVRGLAKKGLNSKIPRDCASAGLPYTDCSASATPRPKGAP